MPIQKFQNAYEVSISKKADHLEFVTDNVITYKIYTASGKKIIPGFIFSNDIIYFVFYMFGKSVKDERVMPTILNFIIDIFEDKNAILAYIYSAANKLHAAREKYFNTLFSIYGAKFFNKIDFDLGEDGKAALIYLPNNINTEALQSLTAEQIIYRIENKNEFDDYDN